MCEAIGSSRNLHAHDNWLGTEIGDCAGTVGGQMFYENLGQVLRPFEELLPGRLVTHPSFAVLRQFFSLVPQDYSVNNACLELRLSAPSESAIDAGISHALTHHRNTIVYDNLSELRQALGNPDSSCWRTAIETTRRLQEQPGESELFKLVHSIWYCFDGALGGSPSLALIYFSLVPRPIELTLPFTRPPLLDEAIGLMLPPDLLVSCQDSIRIIEETGISGLALAHIGVSGRSGDRFPKIYVAGRLSTLVELARRLDLKGEHTDAFKTLGALTDLMPREHGGAFFFDREGLEKLDIELGPISEAPGADPGYFEKLIRSLRGCGSVQWDKEWEEQLFPWFAENRRHFVAGASNNVVLTFSHLKLVWRRARPPELKGYFIFHQLAKLRT